MVITWHADEFTSLTNQFLFIIYTHKPLMATYSTQKTNLYCADNYRLFCVLMYDIRTLTNRHCLLCLHHLFSVYNYLSMTTSAYPIQTCAKQISEENFYLHKFSTIFLSSGFRNNSFKNSYPMLR